MNYSDLHKAPSQSSEQETRCEVEWERPKGLCNPHRCDLLSGHKGRHVCDCGWVRRAMKRDDPAQFESLQAEVSERTKLIREQQRSGSGEVTAVMVSQSSEQGAPCSQCGCTHATAYELGRADERTLRSDICASLAEALKLLSLRVNPKDTECMYCWCNAWNWTQHASSCLAARTALAQAQKEMEK